MNAVPNRKNTILLALGLSSAMLVAAPSFAQAQSQAAKQTQALIAQAKQWQKAKGKNKDKALAKLEAMVQKRQGLLNELSHDEPAQALGLVIPAQKKTLFPAQVLAQLEQQVKLEGELVSEYVEQEDGSHELRRYLNTPAGDRFQLRSQNAEQLPMKGQVEVQGTLLADDGLLLEGQASLMLAADGGVGTNGTALSTGPAIGEQKTLVMLVNFQDDTSTPWTLDDARDIFFNQTDAYVREVSDGRAWLSGDVIGWLNLPLSKQTCVDADIVAAAQEQARAQGVDLSRYNRFAYAFPYTSACKFSGVGSVGGYTSSMLLNGALRYTTATHEYGHNLGLFHSHALECGSNSIGGSCSTDEYGDGVDMMGRMTGHFNAFQKNRLKWLDAGEIATVNQSGTYTLAGLANMNASGIKTLRIPKGTDSNGRQQYYWVEFRQPVGIDGQFAASDNLTNGVVVHQGTEGLGNSSFLIDMTPGSGGSNYSDTRDPALEVGYSFVDDDAGVSITTDWVSGDKASVTVQLDGSQPQPTCQVAAPSLSVTPGQSQWVAAGTAVNYQVTITNRDSQACANSNFNLSASVPGGWAKSLSSSSVNLAPGQSGNLTLKVTSASNADDGFYAIGVNGAGSQGSASQSVTYVVENPAGNSAPVANNDSASTQAGQSVTINVLGSDSDPDGDALSVTSTSGVNGSARINSNGTITFTPASGFSGTEVFSYVISDGKLSTSANVTVSVSAPVTSNKAPVAVGDSATTSGGSITIAVLGNDHDPDGDSLKVTGATQGSKGSVRVNSDGTITYTPGKHFKNGDSFSYTISDGELTASAQVSIGGSGGGKGNGNGGGGRWK